MAIPQFDKSSLSQSLDRSNLIPTKIISQELLSPTSEAYDCFTGQKFCGNLQAFLITYVMTTSSYYSVYM